MSAAGRFLRKIEEGYVHWCPGCRQMHAIWVDEKHPGTGAIWTFDGNFDAPTFGPSINIVGQCHYFVRAGRLEFCSDSRHDHAGKVVDMTEISNDMWPD